MSTADTRPIVVSCHCGAVEIRLDAAPTEVTDCNCSLCRRYGVLWAYCSADEIGPLPNASLTHAYAWNGRHVDFHRRKACGCITHYAPRDPASQWRAINARLLEPGVLAAARVRHKDGAGSGKYLD